MDTGIYLLADEVFYESRGHRIDFKQTDWVKHDIPLGTLMIDDHHIDGRFAYYPIKINESGQLAIAKFEGVTSYRLCVIDLQSRTIIISSTKFRAALILSFTADIIEMHEAFHTDSPESRRIVRVSSENFSTLE